MAQILDTVVLVLLVLFLVYIFRGYHLTRLDKERKENANSENDIAEKIDNDREHISKD
ncbi:MAG: hypothetical protein AB7U44_00190 [Sulfuricurvum sp.]|uniref:hypothetical protein n=1 Tax=Sulfuricurvum sp. TaxID=2025608 RepID=UPI0026274357|nr:hypothetical protein [Sulfuricurvum sp.]MDD2838561.1 hypothetical protein [Sulfuricurvum sp.]MDD3595181.1 hypothetical protein [Sulfuricurvum sp.]MDD4883611.1 hypothetical protein [Sulfuricurvum sp.]